MKNLIELTKEDLVSLNAGVTIGEDGKGCTEHGATTVELPGGATIVIY